ncbi:MAG: hypothetical protein HC905_32060 [Bacteroidales bacterium]|nr:hypothetical protein [Bacteroidales bacterium]
MVKGLKARGNITVNIDWENGKLVKLSLTPATDKAFVVRYGDKEIKVSPTAGKEIIIGSDFILK